MLAANAMSTAPLLSLIVVCRERGPRLEVTLASIAEQRHVQPEIVVVDCGATETEAVAFNQGLARAHGEWVLFLRAGDRLVGEVTLSEALNWMRKTEAGVAAGEMAYDTGRIVKLRSRVNPVARNFVAPAAAFYRRSLFAENGDFEISLVAMADYEFHLRLWKNRVRFKPIPLRIAAAEAEPVFDWPACREQIRVRHRYFSTWQCWWWDVRSVLRCALRR
jgi:glycosyltransferase involved in cell wall biosynthesis